MPRTKSVSDQVLLDQTLVLMRRVGPDGITFASVATETGLSGPTLVQRFGSKRALLHAALLRAWDLLDSEIARCDAETAETPEGAIEMLVALTAAYGGGHPCADGLLVAREDLRDPVLRRRGAICNEAVATALGRKLADRSGSRPDLGRLMAAQWQGAMLWWGFERKDSLTEWVGDALRAWYAAIGRSG